MSLNRDKVDLHNLIPKNTNCIIHSIISKHDIVHLTSNKSLNRDSVLYLRTRKIDKNDSGFESFLLGIC
jgi:hypothetical protein